MARALWIALTLLMVWRTAVPPPPAQTPAPDPLRRLEEVLSDPNFQRAGGAPPLAEIEAPDLGLPSIDAGLLRAAVWIAGGLALMLATVALGPAVYRFLAARRRGRAPAKDADADGAASPAEAVQRAARASAVQDYRAATRLLYLASLLSLDEAGALRYDRAQTNREYLRQVAGRPVLAEALRPVVETFDDVWYGFRAITAEGYGVFERQVQAVLDAAAALAGQAGAAGQAGR
jgi:hypothetical protein